MSISIDTALSVWYTVYAKWNTIRHVPYMEAYMNESIKAGEIPFTIGILAERAGVPKSTIRDWVDRYHLLDPVAYSQGNRSYPLFDANSVRLAKVIKHLRDESYGFPIIKKRLTEESLDKLEKE